MSIARLYGRFVGNGSAGTVTQGWLAALQSHNMLAGTFGESTISLAAPQAWGGSEAPVAVVTDARLLFHAIGGGHKRIDLVLSLHSAWIPDDLFGLMADERIRVLAPSQFSKNLTLAVDGNLRVVVVRHGISSGFVPIAGDAETALHNSSMRRGIRGEGTAKHLLHLCESSPARKGTRELLSAFDSISQDLDLALTVVPSSVEHLRLRSDISRLKNPERVRILPRFNAPADKLRWVYGSFDVIVQPSRAEGFGLVPLEALACGTPAIVTTRCGHSEWVYLDGNQADGTVLVPLWGAAVADFEPGEVPSVKVEDIVRGIEVFKNYSTMLRESSMRSAQSVRDRWQWPLVTKAWAEEAKETYG